MSPVDSLGVLSSPVVRAKLGKERARDVLGFSRLVSVGDVTAHGRVQD